MASRSLCLPPARTQRCTEAARGGTYGTASSPRKQGTNGIIPELVNMGALGCVGMRLPDGTIVCARAAKKSVKARRNSAEVRGAIGMSSLVGVRTDPVPHSGARGELGPQLGLALAHGAAAVT